MPWLNGLGGPSYPHTRWLQMQYNCATMYHMIYLHAEYHSIMREANEMAAKNGASMPAMSRLERGTLSLVAAAGLACVAVLAVTLG